VVVHPSHRLPNNFRDYSGEIIILGQDFILDSLNYRVTPKRVLEACGDGPGDGLSLRLMMMRCGLASVPSIFILLLLPTSFNKIHCK
jgi:hypothetical protein